MKLRLTGGGFENLTGQFGLYEFENGLSVIDIPPNEAHRLACSVGAVWEDGSPANISELHNIHYYNSVDDLTKDAQLEEVADDKQEQNLEDTQEQNLEDKQESLEDAEETGEEVVKSATWTREELEKIADEKGIKGLREIANEHGVKANSINALIDEILALNP